MTAVTTPPPLQIYSIIIINKAGLLRWTQRYSDDMSAKDFNGQIDNLASFFHGFSIVASQINPMNKESEGIQMIQTNNFVLQCLHTLTEVEFIAVASTSSDRKSVV